MLTWVLVILAAGTMLLLALVMSLILGWANRTFHVEVDPRTEAIQEALPGANCGGCGYVGCNEYAEATAKGEAQPNLCTVGGASVATAIAGILGVAVEETWPYRAVVHCAANYDNRLGRSAYVGEPTCSAANVISGVQGCIYGCLGFGDCVLACDYDAIHMVDGLATVDYEKCVGCGACARVCPRNIISMVPFKAERMFVVACSNKDFGNDVRNVCKVGCIGCKACERVNDLLHIESNVATLNYDNYDPAKVDFSAALNKCPRESMLFVGKPSALDLAAVADEELPDRIEADFKTTADDTEWRG